MLKNDFMNNNDDSEILDALGSIAHTWSIGYDERPSLVLDFSVTDKGNLALNGKELLHIPIKQVDIDSIYVDVEWFGFYTLNGYRCEVKIGWPFDSTASPYIDLVCLTIPIALRV